MDGGSSGYRSDTNQFWDAMPRLNLKAVFKSQQAIAHEKHPAAPAYDLLRTRLLGPMSERHWTRLGVSQAGPRRAGPLAALNLALSEARRPGRSIVLVDLDIARQPIRRCLDAPDIAGVEEGGFRLWRVAEQLALVTVPAPASEAATRLLDPGFGADLDMLLAKLGPDLAILHLPPLLAGDAGLAGLPLAEGLLLVVDGQSDTAAGMRECQSRMGDLCPLLGLFHYDAEV